MLMTPAQKKFLSLSVAAIVVVQALRATDLYAGPPARDAGAPAARPAAVEHVEALVDEPVFPDAPPEFTEQEWYEIEMGAEAGASRAAATRCSLSASATGPGVWVSNTADPNYASFRFPFQVACNPVSGATEGCEPFVFVSVTYKMIGGSWSSIGTGAAGPFSLNCGQTVTADAYSPSTIDIVNGANGGRGSYRSTMFVYRESDFLASNWSAFLASNFYDWTY